jgi:hypothetical protein
VAQAEDANAPIIDRALGIRLGSALLWLLLLS